MISLTRTTNTPMGRSPRAPSFLHGTSVFLSGQTRKFEKNAFLQLLVFCAQPVCSILLLVMSTAPSFPAPPPGTTWYDYDVEGQSNQIARVYSKHGERGGSTMRRESQALAMLADRLWVPRIVNAFPELGIYVHELPQGWLTLAQARPRISTQGAVAVWLSVGAALCQSNCLGLWHTQVAPECVIVAPHRVVIRDWGFSTTKMGYHAGRDTRGKKSQKKRTAGPFAPPELSDGTVGRSTDIYSWVGLLYWMLTGDLPCNRPRMLSSEPGASEAETLFFSAVLDAKPERRCTEFAPLLSIAQSWFATHFPPNSPTAQDSHHRNEAASEERATKPAVPGDEKTTSQEKEKRTSVADESSGPEESDTKAIEQRGSSEAQPKGEEESAEVKIGKEEKPAGEQDSTAGHVNHQEHSTGSAGLDVEEHQNAASSKKEEDAQAPEQSTNAEAGR